ncbi:MAG: hypothetical protein JWL87_427 [Candidatus Adlerbacteria bacterium]|nr:hypothetical protein [Candidatus Adlerbacteria bacterium]
MPFIALAAALVLALGGGASIAANQSLPGDALYGVKVNVNENIDTALSFSAQSKAESHIGAIETRISEVQKLSAGGSLSADAQADINANIEAHAQAVMEAVADLQAKGDYAAAAEVAAKFQSSMTEHASILVQAQGNADANARAAVAPVISKVQATLNAASNLSASASANAAAHGGAGSSNSGTSASSSAQGSTGTQGSVQVDVGHNDDDGTADQGHGDINVQI